MALEKDPPCCLSRRRFLCDALEGAASLVVAGGLFHAVFGDPVFEEELLVVLFLRGAFDALNLVLPLEGEDRAAYEAERPFLKIPASGAQAALKLDARFGLHPSAAPLLDLYTAKKLAIILATGLPSDTRSHFDAQNYMELGTPDKKTTSSGWLARHLARGPESAFGAVSVGALLPTSLLSLQEAVAVANPAGFNLGGPRPLQLAQREALGLMYRGEGWLGRYGLEALKAVERLDGAAANYVPSGGDQYPKGELGNKLKALAQLVKMPLGVKAAAVDFGGWDTHKYQGEGSQGFFANHVDELARALAAFYGDLSGRRLSIVVMSEFGRRVKENANRGTDHGHGSLMLALGDGIYGGQLYGRWPGLKVEELYDRADLAVATDFRRVLSELLIRRRRDARLSKIFPGYAGYRPLGFAQGTDLRPS